MSSLTEHRPDPAPSPAGRKGGRRLGLVTGLIAVTSLVAVSLWSAIAPPPGRPAMAPPLAYVPVAADTPSEAARQLAGRFGVGTVAEVLHLTAIGEDRPLARVEVARLPDGRAHLLGWRSLGTVPILRRDITASEELQLVEALARHLPADSTILALPELSRRLSAQVEARYPMVDEPEPLIVPTPWRGEAAAITAAESELWTGAASDGAAPGPVVAFIDALLTEDVHGAARLRVMAGTGETYVLVHLDDAFQIGQLRPGRLGIERQGFVGEGFSHDLARAVRTAAQAGGHAAWAVDRAPDGRLRGHFLTDQAETATLIAQLLPFNTSRIDQVLGVRLVWQASGYWLYRLVPLTDG